MHPAPSDRHQALHDDVDRPLGWRVFGQFHRAIHAHRQLMMRLLAERGTHPAQAICLRELAHNDGVSQRDLAELLNVSRPTVTVMLQKMEKAGLVERVIDENDQRYTRIHLTEAGWSEHEQMHRLLDRFIAETIERLSDEDQLELERLLGELNEHFSEALEAEEGEGL